MLEDLNFRSPNGLTNSNEVLEVTNTTIYRNWKILRAKETSFEVSKIHLNQSRWVTLASQNLKLCKKKKLQDIFATPFEKLTQNYSLFVFPHL